MIDDKYVVFKREDIKGAGAHDYYNPKDALDDAVVIRKKDAHAPAALFAYASAAALAGKLLRDLGQRDLAKTQQDIADYFIDQSDDCVNYDSRLPD